MSTAISQPESSNQAHELRFRQVHLDFHTSEHIPGVGSEFDPEQFAHTLKSAYVDSVTLFSRCHHGWIYHDTKFPNRHPNLTCNLLAEQIRACHSNDIRCPIYITVGWDELTARTHPEWIEVHEDGKRDGAKPLSPGWHKLDFASPYLDYVVEQTEEVLDMFGDEVDGVFFDIIHVRGVHSTWCLSEFQRLGWDPATDQPRMRALLLKRYVDRISGAVRAKNSNCTIFHNAGHVSSEFRPVLNGFSHLELESLPTGGWGYMHFPMTVRYARTLGKDYLGMTGKFSETWGHFNSYKPKAALEYECFSALAQGGKCSIGDQLHPTGVLDAPTYKLIGSVYKQIAEREPWCRGARSVTEIAVLSAELFQTSGGRINEANLGATRVLMEGRHQFDIVDFETDLSDYRVVLLPDLAELDAQKLAWLDKFVADGGAILATGSSGFGLCGFPAELVGGLPFSPDFLLADPAMEVEGAEGPFVMYESGRQVRPTKGAEILAKVCEPYFNRTWDHFCSHAHAPVRGEGPDPAALLEGRIGYLAHPVFTTYARHSMPLHRELVLSMLRRLLPEPLLSVDGPKSLQATLTQQEDRRIVHLLHYIPERRGLALDVVEDRLPVHDVNVTLRGQVPASVWLQPQGVPLSFEAAAGVTRFKVPVVSGHQMIVLEA
jgi:Hypothetical glycosyl hydrolase 6